MRTDISPERKASYYVGMALAVIGFLMFLAPFATMIGGAQRTVAAITQPGGPNGMPDFGGVVASFGTGFVGFLLVIVGNFLMVAGRAGLAGSGVILDPEGARQDLRPWNEASGRMINDAVSQIDMVQQIAHDEAPETVVKIRCRQCQALNDESQAFCGHCGAKL